MSVEKIARLREIRAERMKLHGQLAQLTEEARQMGQLIQCGECRVEDFFAAPGDEENLPAGWVMSDCDHSGCVHCWAFWCPEHSGLAHKFECAACHC